MFIAVEDRPNTSTGHAHRHGGVEKSLSSVSVRVTRKAVLVTSRLMLADVYCVHIMDYSCAKRKPVRRVSRLVAVVF